ncbi:hypothetical protein ONS95_010870 [Cadophora gregata]|uniref:uncharacterized protein n=1 Tax=Cadophora gregata TaxID=51156 RepID=UPI0026DAC206|nr:uncharacterized protein ONS95_010870 [Cadophora gregata]KAK0119418.1 hypothetical protein ONS95_010870 [Cadophora gregata]KAK0120455.1 hypothetical protein ONS96_010669 [Cadophora gregata f. sp. sojae]
MQLINLLSPLLLIAPALATPLSARAKAAGGPASAKITVYQSYTCPSPTATPPTDGTAGVSSSVTIAEATCAVLNVPFGGALTAVLTAPPKTGAAGCAVIAHTDGNCLWKPGNELHGFAFDGLATGNKVGCGNVPVRGYGAVELLCE